MSETSKYTTPIVVEGNATLRVRECVALGALGSEMRPQPGVAIARREMAAEGLRRAVVDPRLPDYSILETVDALKTTTSGVRAGILTGHDKLATAPAVARTGATEYIDKPAINGEIIDVLAAPSGNLPPPSTKTIEPDSERWGLVGHFHREAGNNVSTAAQIRNVHGRCTEELCNEPFADTECWPMRRSEDKLVVLQVDQAVPPVPEDPSQHTVYIDGSCPLCSVEVNHYALDRNNRVGFVDVSEATANLGADLTPHAARRRFHVRLPDGTLLSGARAFIAIWRTSFGWCRLAPIAAIPGVASLLEGLYRAFLPIRPAMSRLAGLLGPQAAKPSATRP